MCVNNWDDFIFGQEYSLVVEGVSELYGTRGEGVVKFYLQGGGKRGEKRGEKRQTKVGCGLWDIDGEDLYGIRTYPSGNVYLPSSVRGEGLMVLLKGLTRCEEVEMSKEILAQGEVTWELGGEGGLDGEEYSDGTRLFLPPSLLSEKVAPGEWVEVAVRFVLEDGRSFSSSFSFQFSPGGVEFVVLDDPGTVIVADSSLVFNLENSLTEDVAKGLVERGEQEWEWDWDCINPVTGEGCEYEDGREVELPGRGEGRWESEGEFKVGEAMMFVVRVKVVGGAGEEGVSTGRWARVVSFVEEKVGFELVYSEWWCLFGEGQYGYNVCDFFFLLLLSYRIGLFYLLYSYIFSLKTKTSKK